MISGSTGCRCGGRFRSSRWADWWSVSTIRYLPGTGGHAPAEGFKPSGAVPPIELPGIIIAAFATLSCGAVLGPEAPLIAIGSGMGVLAVHLVRRSRVSTKAYDLAHRTMACFVGAEPATSAVIFGKNATEAINKLAFRYPLARRSVVLSTLMEHHSNDLPWRGRATVVRAKVTRDGRLDEEDFERAARRLRRSRRARHRQRGLERHRLRSTDPSSGAQSARGWRANPDRRLPTGCSSPYRRQAGHRSRASRFRGAVRPQDVRAVRHRGADRESRCVSPGCTGVPGRWHCRRS